MLPSVNRARVLRVDLAVVAHDFLARHGKHANVPTLPDHPKPLRQDALPDDATVLFAHIEEGDAAAKQAMRDAREMVLRLADGLIVPEAERTELLARLDAAVAAPPARYLVVGIESRKFRPVERGAEPEHPMDYAAFAPKKGGVR